MSRNYIELTMIKAVKDGAVKKALLDPSEITLMTEHYGYTTVSVFSGKSKVCVCVTESIQEIKALTADSKPL